MASSKEYLEYIMEQLSETEDVSYRAMMGEYVIYCRGRVVGGVYDDRFLVKPVRAALAMMPDAQFELPYEGGREMLLVTQMDNKPLLQTLLEGIAREV